ncbi:MAG: T9SS type A sorting domain-containing protein, partial [Lacibacter sp.]|nr:T9SS type A sorting domain-containing protein [Lacibacter sp.]
IYAVQDGDWNSNSTWSLNRPPQQDEIVCIPVGITVNLSGTYNYSTTRLQIFVCGTLNFNFNPPGKLSLAAWSFIQVYADGFILSRNGDAELINIGGVDVWRHGNADIEGPWVLSHPYVGAGVLPVAFDYFKAEQKQPYTVRLEWATLLENNSAAFVIERSADQKGWTEIGSIHSEGNSSSRKVYSHLDMQPVTGYNYYRLKQVDIDGQTTYSQIIRINNQVRKNLSVFPNPVGNVTQLYGKESFKAGQTIQVIDAKGTRLKTINPTGGNRLQIDLSGYSAGLYLLQLLENGKVVENLQVVKQ